MKHPKFTLLDTKTIDQQIREIEERLIVRRYSAELHAAALKTKFHNKVHDTLTSPKTLMAAGAIGFGLGFLNPFGKKRKKDAEKALDDRKKERRQEPQEHEEEHHSMLSSLLKAWPIVELIINAMPNKHESDESPQDGESLTEQADDYRDEVLTDAVLSGKTGDQTQIDDAHLQREYLAEQGDEISERALERRGAGQGHATQGVADGEGRPTKFLH